MYNRRKATGSREQYPARDLSYVVTQGGRLRSNRYLHELREFLWPTTLAIILLAVCYIIVITRSGRSDWNNILIAAGGIAAVPVASAAILAGLRRHKSAIVTSSILTIGLFSVAVSLLSGMRISMSYQGLAACLPAMLLVMAYANIRFQRTLRTQVALANFAGAGEVSNELGGVPIVHEVLDDLPDIEVLLIDPREHHSELWSNLLATAYLRGIEIMPWTTYREILRGRLDVGTFEISHLAYTSDQLFYTRCKRYLDIIAVLLSLPVTVPVAALTALYIGFRDGFPVIFVQLRRGYGGRRFRMYKFRTMYKGSEGGSTSHNDNRVIAGCHLIRKLRFDELPQLFNILQGDMSLIGPRPVAEYVARSISTVEPKYQLRSLVLPGITGWAQVRSGYAATTEEEIEKLSYDLYYIKHLSLDLDLLILFKTIRTVVLGIGAR
ncbi:sugar transferase [Devosia sp. MC532]|uniref:sugar transferase n=1 Tax=Devosia sp. MC532 TaxID=2799788 RepID=UPI0018F63EA8|nr:sugar transferase [Devosia sp. MC532]MBJ7579508.1 sugar transferase [Devosia sp. MC532]